MRVRTTIAAVAAALALSVTTGCAIEPQLTEEPPEGQPEVTATPRVDTAGDISLPFDAYGLSNAEDERSLRAYHGLLSTCARRFGITLTMPVAVNPGIDHSNARRYGIIDPGLAATHGYGVRPVPEPPRWQPAPGELKVLDGVAVDDASRPRGPSGELLPTGGCIAEAERLLGGAPPYSTERMEGSANEDAEQHPRVKGAFASWSSCMADRGHRYTSPWEPNDREWPDPPSADEIRTARDDLACRAQTHLAGTWLAVESALQQRLIARNRPQFDQLARWKFERLERVRAIEADRPAQ